MKLSTSLCLVASVLLLAFLIVDGFIKEDAMRENEKLVKNLRKGRTTFLDYFLIFFSALLYSEVLIVIMFLSYFCCKDKLFGLSVLAQISIGVFINSVSKLIYAQGRPFYLFASIDRIGKCERDLGHPSGHAMMGLVAIILFIDWFLHDREVAQKYRMEIDNSRMNQMQQTSTNKNLAIFLYIIGSMVIFTIGLSRVYLGAHSFEQVLSGWAYGLLYIICYFTFLRELVLSSLKELGESKSIFGFGGFFAFIIITAIGVFCLVLPIITFEVMENPAKRNHFMALAFVKCGDTKYLSMDRKIFSDCGIIGLLVGLLFASYLSKGEVDENHMYDQSTSKLPCSKVVIRFLFMLLFFGIMITLVLTLNLTENIMIIYILGGFFNFFFFSFSYVFILPIIFKRLSLTYSGDFMKYPEYGIA